MNKSTPSPAPDARLLETLGWAGRWLDSRLDTALADYGLSTSKLAVLRQLAQADQGMPLGQLAGRLDCVRSNITQLIDRLEGDGLVRRLPDAEDRRSLRAAITEEGRRRYRLGLRVEQSLQRQVAKCLTPGEQDQLLGLLNKFRLEEHL